MGGESRKIGMRLGVKEAKWRRKIDKRLGGGKGEDRLVTGVFILQSRQNLDLALSFLFPSLSDTLYLSYSCKSRKPSCFQLLSPPALSSLSPSLRLTPWLRPRPSPYLSQSLCLASSVPGFYDGVRADCDGKCFHEAKREVE